MREPRSRIVATWWGTPPDVNGLFCRAGAKTPLDANGLFYRVGAVTSPGFIH